MLSYLLVNSLLYNFEIYKLLKRIPNMCKNELKMNSLKDLSLYDQGSHILLSKVKGNINKINENEGSYQ